MVLGIIKNRDNSYEYLLEQNNKISFIHIDKLGYISSNKNYIYNLFSFLFDKKKYTFFKSHMSYKIFYEERTKLFHFINEDKEDYGMFFDNNGVNAIMYVGSNKINGLVKKIFIASLGITLILNASIVNYLDNLTSYDYYKTIEDVNVVNNSIDYRDAINFINNSNLNDDLKKYLCNEELLMDIFSYYSDSAMEYKNIFSLNNIEIVYYDSVESENIGYYNPVYPNRIYIAREYKNSNNSNRIVAHEFIHILQDQHCQYNYILETIDELMLKEYFNEKVISYKSGVKNLMLLIDVIGVEPVMQLVFAGNSDSFENILKENLDSENYNLLISYFKDASLCSGHNQENKEIRLILCSLYQNLYHKDINDDSNILYNTIYKDNKIKCNDIKKFYINQRYVNNLSLKRSKEVI